LERRLIEAERSLSNSTKSGHSTGTWEVRSASFSPNFKTNKVEPTIVNGNGYTNVTWVMKTSELEERKKYTWSIKLKVGGLEEDEAMGIFFRGELITGGQEAVFIFPK
jgi:hypothetical protein